MDWDLIFRLVVAGLLGAVIVKAARINVESFSVSGGKIRLLVVTQVDGFTIEDFQ